MSKSANFGTYLFRVLIKARSTPVPMAASTSIYRRSDFLVFCDLVYLSRFIQPRCDGRPPDTGPLYPGEGLAYLRLPSRRGGSSRGSRFMTRISLVQTTVEVYAIPFLCRPIVLTSVFRRSWKALALPTIALSMGFVRTI